MAQKSRTFLNLLVARPRREGRKSITPPVDPSLRVVEANIEVLPDPQTTVDDSIIGWLRSIHSERFTGEASKTSTAAAAKG